MSAYHLPRDLVAELTVTLLHGGARPVLADMGRMKACLPRPPIVSGVEEIPVDGPLIVVGNHYQRRDLWIGWAGSLLMCITRRHIHWAVLRELRVAGRELPATRWLFERVALAYGFVPVPDAGFGPAGRAGAVRQMLRLLRGGESVGFFPEGQRGHAGGLSAPVTGAPALAALLSREAPLLPAAVWEEGKTLHVAVGRPFRLKKPDGRALMMPIAGLLPEGLRGIYL